MIHDGLFFNKLNLSILNVHDSIYLRYFTTCFRVNNGTKLHIALMKNEPSNDYLYNIHPQNCVHGCRDLNCLKTVYTP